VKAKKKKKSVRKAKITTTAADMVKKANVIVLKKKPAAGEVPPQVEKIVEILEQRGGELPEHELLPLLGEELPSSDIPYSHTARSEPTLWEYWRGKLEDMGILSVKTNERTDE